jgi:hypothetical protein
LHTPLYHIFFPTGYDSLASFASVHLPDIMVEVKRETGVGFKDEPNIVIYPSPDQLYESNIGLYEKQVQTFPTINLKGNRVVVAFNGSWAQFRLQLKEAWVRLCWEQQFKNDLEEQLTNRKQTIPAWFKSGSIQYYTYGWRIADESRLKQLFKQHPDRFESLIKDDESLSGQAFSYFLSQQYRDDATKQIIFQMRQGKSLARAARLVTKRRLDTLQSECVNFYSKRFPVGSADKPSSADTLKPFLEKTYKGKLFTLNFNYDSSHVYFVIASQNKRAMYTSLVRDLGKPKQKLKPFAHYDMPPWLDHFAQDPYPIIQWKGKGGGFDLTMPVKGKMLLQQYDGKRRLMDTRTLYGVDGVNTIQEWQRSYLLSAYRKGRSDIVQYDPQRLRYHTLTSDPSDHTELAVSEQNAEIAYRSGYPADSLYHVDSVAKPYGIYTKSIQEDPKIVAKAKDQLIAKDSAYITVHDPEYKAGQLYVSSTASGKVEEVKADSYSLIPRADGNLLTPWLADYMANQKEKDSIAHLLRNIKEQDVSVLKKILTPGDTKAAADLHEDGIRRAVAYTAKKVRPYILQLYSSYFSAQINNDYYINRYQPFQAYLATFKFPEVGAMAQGGFSDLFGNHHFNIGYRMPAGTEGSDFFVRYENTARKLDWHLLFFRKVESLQPDAQRDWKDARGNPYPQSAKVKTHYYELGFHYPLAYDWSLDFTTAARRDRTIFLATDRYSLTYEALQAWWSISSLSLSINKLQPTIPFLYKGYEAKAMLDFMASTGKASTILYGTQVNVAYHLPIIKDITLVARAQAGYSGGQSKILYNFGGMDNNIVPRVDTSVRFGQDAPYAFQTIVTPFRGYAQNSIYGSRYGLLNIDVYFPLFRTLIPLQTSFGALNSLQLGLFTDVAVTGRKEQNVSMTSSLTSYGVSARTMLAGYPLRFDIAWPGNFNEKPVWYLSLVIK